MAKRLQVILKDPEYREIQRAARARHITVAAWVRQALEAARRQHPVGDAAKKLAAIRAAVQLNLGPAVDIEQMLAEIEKGYLADSSPMILVHSNIPLFQSVSDSAASADPPCLCVSPDAFCFARTKGRKNTGATEFLTSAFSVMVASCNAHDMMPGEGARSSASEGPLDRTHPEWQRHPRSDLLRIAIPN